MSTIKKLEALIEEYRLPTDARTLYSLVRDVTDTTNVTEQGAVDLMRGWLEEPPGERWPTTPADCADVVWSYDRPRAYLAMLRGAALEACGYEVVR